MWLKNSLHKNPQKFRLKTWSLNKIPYLKTNKKSLNLFSKPPKTRFKNALTIPQPYIQILKNSTKKSSLKNSKQIPTNSPLLFKIFTLQSKGAIILLLLLKKQIGVERTNGAQFKSPRGGFCAWLEKRWENASFLMM